MWESRGRSPLGKVRRQQQKPSQSQHSPKQTQHPKMRGCRKNGERSKAVILIKCADPTSPAFSTARPPDVGKTRKERSDFAALSSPNPNKGDSPCQAPHSAGLSYLNHCSVRCAYRFCAFTAFVQGRAPLKGFACGRHTRKIPLSQGFSSFKTVHRTVLKFTFFGAPFGGDFAVCGRRRLGLLAPLDPLGNGWRVVASRAF